MMFMYVIEKASTHVSIQFYIRILVIPFTWKGGKLMFSELKSALLT